MNGLSMNEALEAKRKAGEEPDTETLVCPCCGFRLAHVGNYFEQLDAETGEKRPLRVAKLHEDIIENTAGEYVRPTKVRPYTQTGEGKAQQKKLEDELKFAQVSGNKKAEREAWEKLRVLKHTGARRYGGVIYLTAEQLKPVRCKCGRLVILTLRANPLKC